MKHHKFSSNSLAELDGIHPIFSYLSHKVLKRSKYDLGFPSGTAGFRTAERQKMAYMSGFSKCDGTIEISKHQEGLALDFMVYIDGNVVWADTHPEAYAYVATLYLEEMLKIKTLVASGHYCLFSDLLGANILEADLVSGVSFDDHGHLELRNLPPHRERQ